MIRLFCKFSMLSYHHCDVPGHTTYRTYSHSISAYYLPRSSLSSSVTLTQIPGKTSFCEWKGKATYWTLKNNATNEEVKGKIWSYESPTQPFKDIKGYLSFYASGVPWECFVDDEKVQPQEGECLSACNFTMCSDRNHR
jgi:uncharacterized protein (DUF427 family)